MATKYKTITGYDSEIVRAMNPQWGASAAMMYSAPSMSAPTLGRMRSAQAAAKANRYAEYYRPGGPGAAQALSPQQRALLPGAMRTATSGTRPAAAPVAAFKGGSPPAAATGAGIASAAAPATAAPTRSVLPGSATYEEGFKYGKPTGNQLYDEFARKQVQANNANLTRFNQGKKGYSDLHTRGMGYLDDLGNQELADVNQAYDAAGARMRQGLVDRGLGGTTIAPTMELGNERERTSSLQRTREGLARERLNADNALTGQYLQFLERRNDEGPSDQMLAQLAMMQGQAAGSGGLALAGGYVPVGGGAGGSAARPRQPGNIQVQPILVGGLPPGLSGGGAGDAATSAALAGIAGAGRAIGPGGARSLSVPQYDYAALMRQMGLEWML